MAWRVTGALRVRRHCEPGCRRDLQRVYRRHGPDGGGGRLRCGGAAADGRDRAGLYEGIAQAVPGNRVVDISRAIQNYVEGNGFSVVREFVGHGVGRSMHEEPQVPNFVDGEVVAEAAAGHDAGH